MRRTNTTMPEGTVALLFSDIEGSTKRWELAPETMSSALALHDRIVRDAIESNQGYVFKTMGDAFCAAFSSPPDAIAAALSIQRSLRAADFSHVGGLSVRVALHFGGIEARDGDYFGPTVNRVARLLSVTYGGQTLLTEAAAGSTVQRLPTGVTLRDLGWHRLRDIAEREHVYQLIAPDLEEQFPPLASLEATPNNVPEPASSFIGRQADAAEITALVRQRRLVTVAGAGGVGKTRIALRCARESIDLFADGVWLVELASIAEPALVAGAIAAPMGVRQHPERPVIESLIEYLARRCVLVVLDNCEHVIDEAARIAESILRNCPNVHVLATSRQSLSLDGEHVYRLPSLDTPTGVELFIERARAADRTFAPSPETRATIEQICERLDGIPLAIELAAARISAINVKNLAARLDERFRVLTGGSRAALPHHQTMRATIDWSYDLLSHRERKLLDRLSVFAGGCDLESVESVVSDDAFDQRDVFDTLGSLVEKSLLIRERNAAADRYRMLQSIRAYASERLEAEGETALFARAHAIWAAELVARMDDEYGTMPYNEWLTAYSAEIDNVRAALEWALGSHGDVLLGGGIAARAYGLWFQAGLVRDGRRWVHTALERVDETAHAPTVARLWFADASLSGAKHAVDSVQRAIVLFEGLGMKLEHARSCSALAFYLVQAGKPREALVAIERALASLHELGLTQGQRYAGALNILGTILNSLDRGEEARSAFERSAALFAALEDPAGAAFPRFNLAELEFRSGRIPQALELAQAVAQTAHELRDATSEAAALCTVAASHLALGAAGLGESAAKAALDISRNNQWLQGSVVAIGHIAAALSLRGDLERAARLMGLVESSRHEGGFEREPPEQCTYDLLIQTLRSRLSLEQIQALADEGALWTLDRACAEAADHGRPLSGIPKASFHNRLK